MKGYQVLPLGDRLLVQSIKQKDTTEGGIVLPDQSREVYNFGIVLAVGPDVNKEILAGGGYVMYLPYAGIPVAAEKGQLILNEADIIAKLVKEQ